MGLLSKMFGNHSAAAAEETDGTLALGKKNADLAIYFEPQPHDRVWKHITYENAAELQKWFNVLRMEAKLDRFTNVNDLDMPTANAMSAVACRALDQEHVPTNILLLLGALYIGADVMMRQMYATRWVGFIVKRPSFAESPESYAQWVMDNFFSGPGA